MPESITNSQLNTMNQLLFAMRRLKPNQRAPTFTISDITSQWHTSIDANTSESTITAILQQGSSTGFFIFAQSIEGVLSYGYSANMLRLNPKNKLILLDAPAADRVCLEPCNIKINRCMANNN